MLCARECPDWCIYIDSHKETIRRARGRPRAQRNVLDRFAIDFSLCMYCGICIEVCPFDALFWSPEFEYAELDIRDLTHEQGPARASGCGPCRRRRRSTHGDRPRSRRGARRPRRGAASGCATEARRRSDRRRGDLVRPARRWSLVASRALLVVTPGSWCTPRCGWSSRSARWPAATCCCGRVRRLGAGADLRRRGRRAAAVRPDADPRADRGRPPTSTDRRCSRLAAAVVAARAGRRRRGRRRRRVPGEPGSTSATAAAAPRVGRHGLFRAWVLPFEVLSVLLLAALVGAIVLSRRDIGPADGEGDPAGGR